MLSMVLTWLGSFLSGPLLTGALKAYQAKLAADSDEAKLAASLTAQQEAIEQATVRAEEAGWFPFVRWGFACPFVLFNAKVIVWDRMMHMGVTDPLSPELLQLEAVIVAAYFGHSAVTIVGRALARRAN